MNPAHPLRYPDFILFCIMRFSSVMGIQMLAVALAWHLYDLTHDPFDLGLAGLFQFLAMFSFVLIGGDAADRYDRRKVLGAAFTLAGLAAALLWRAGTLQTVWPLFTACFMVGVARAFAAPASQAMLANIVPSAVYPRAIALSGGFFQTALIGGPAAAGLLYQLGAEAVYGISFLLLIVAALAVLMIRTKVERNPQKMNVKTILAGWHYVRGHPLILQAISLDLFAVLLGGVVALLPIFAKDILHTDAAGLGFLRAAPAVGALIMSVYLTQKPLTRRVGFWLFVSVAVFGVMIIVFALSKVYWLSLSALLILGAADMVSVFVRTHLVNANTPDDMRGRVSAVSSLFITTSNELGEFESGTSAALFGAVPAALLGGVLTLTVTGLWAWKAPQLRRVDTL